MIAFQCKSISGTVTINMYQFNAIGISGIAAKTINAGKSDGGFTCHITLNSQFIGSIVSNAVIIF